MARTCPRCHQESPDGARFCFNPSCVASLDEPPAPPAAPAPEPRRGAPRWVWPVAAVALVAIAAVTWVVTGSGKGGSGSVGSTVATTAAVTSTVASVATTATTPAPTTTTTRPLTADEKSLAALDQAVASDKARADALVGSWLAQISAKKVGSVWGKDDTQVSGGTPVTWTIQDIAELVVVYRDYFKGHMIVTTGDRYGMGLTGMWVIFSDTAYTSAADVNAWCDATGFSYDNCFARKLGGAPGDVVLRPKP